MTKRLFRQLASVWLIGVVILTALYLTSLIT